MSEWKEIELGELCQIKGGKRLPKGEQLSETITDHPYIRTRDLANNKIAIQNLLFVPNNVFPKISRYIVEEGDVIISIVGTIGLIARIPIKLHLASLTENCAKLVGINQKIIDKEFLFYFLISDEGQDEIDQRNVGSTQPKLPLYNIKSIPIPIPPLAEQKAIASVLSSFDDKIDLLYRQNKNLEAMAETLFRQWFVEEAKENWEKGKLGEIIKIGSGKGLKKEKFIMGGIYPILGANGEIGRTNEYLFDDRLIFTGRVGTLGNVFRIENEKVWLSDNTLVIHPKKYYNFIYFVLKDAKLEQYNVGSTQPLLRQSDIKEIELTLAKENIHIDFEEYSNLLFEKINKNQTQIRTLEKIRDTLLPKLMSGEIRVIL